MKFVSAAAACAVLSFGRWGPAVQAGFDDITVKAGVAKPHHNRQFDNQNAKIMAGYTALGASAAVADYDGDGFEDIFVTDSAADGRNHLYHNNGNLTFTDVAAQAGIGTGNDPQNASADALWFFKYSARQPMSSKNSGSSPGATICAASVRSSTVIRQCAQDTPD